MNSTSYSPKLIRRLRAFLSAQLGAYLRYQRLMTLQETALSQGQYDVFRQRLEVEETVMKELAALDKVIRPLEKDLTSRGGGNPGEDGEEPSLGALRLKVEEARLQAFTKNRSIQNLLASVCHRLKSELPHTKRVSRFAGGSPGPAPRFIDISA